MIEKLGFTGNQRFEFERFEAVHNVLWAMQKRSKWRMLIFCKPQFFIHDQYKSQEGDLEFRDMLEVET